MKQIIIIGPIVILLFGISLGLGPQYNIYANRMAGEADLAHAEFSKRIAVTTAQAELDAAKLKALADIERAKGISEANKIVAASLGGPEGYLRWLYIDMLKTADNHGHTVIYVPTEAGLPILEAGKRKGD